MGELSSTIGDLGRSSFCLHFGMNVLSHWRVGDWMVGRLVFGCYCFQGVMVGTIFLGIGSFLKRHLSPGVCSWPNLFLIDYSSYSPILYRLDHSYVVILYLILHRIDFRFNIFADNCSQNWSSNFFLII